ncbi:FAD-binding protein, partial [Acinetobacter baumannii]
GLSFALEFIHQHPECHLTLITKNKLVESNSAYAQGGFAATVSSERSLSAHVEDTLRAGDGLCDVGAVNEIIGSSEQSLNF